MTGTENIRCAIRFQKEKHIYAELPRNTKRFLKDGLQIQVLEEKEGDCRIGKLSLNIKNESCRENANLDGKSDYNMASSGTAGKDYSNVSF